MKLIEVYAGDVIEDCVFEVSEDGLHIVLIGDFSKTVEKYASLTEVDGIRLNIATHHADALCESLYEIKHG